MVFVMQHVLQPWLRPVQDLWNRNTLFSIPSSLEVQSFNQYFCQKKHLFTKVSYSVAFFLCISLARSHVLYDSNSIVDFSVNC